MVKFPFDLGKHLICQLAEVRSFRNVLAYQTAPAPQTYRIGEFTFHPDSLRLDYAGTSEELSPREAKILELLCASKGETLYTRPLLLEIWGDDNYFNLRSLNVYITRLRNHFKTDHTVEIESVRGIGYKLKY